MLQQFIDEVSLVDIKNFVFCRRNKLLLKFGILTNLESKSKLYYAINNDVSCILRYEKSFKTTIDKLTLSDILNSDSACVKYSVLVNNIVVRYMNFDLVKDIFAHQNLSIHDLQKRFPHAHTRKLLAFLSSDITDDYIEKYKNLSKENKMIAYYNIADHGIDIDRSIEFCNLIINELVKDDIDRDKIRNIYTSNVSETKQAITRFEKTVNKALENIDIYKNINHHIDRFNKYGCTFVGEKKYGLFNFTHNFPFTTPLIRFATSILKTDTYTISDGHIEKVK